MTKRVRVGDINPSNTAISWSEFFAKKAAHSNELKPLGRPCHDCAVESEFYSPHSDLLAKEPIEIQVAASLRWFCHNHPDRACRGNINRLKIEELVP